MNLRTVPAWPLLAVAALAAGCGSSVDLNPTKAPVETRRTGPSTTTALAPAATPQSRVATIDTAASPSTTLAPAATAGANGRTVYFDFDSFVVKDEYRPLIEGQAKALSATRTKRLTIEGHTDARGGSEYNLALGQKRAEAVARSLALLGATPAQIEAVSFGKERPADTGTGEAAWAKNRRAELKDR